MGAAVSQAGSPRSLWHLCWVFNRLSLQGFGGVLPVAQREIVEREQWLDAAAFLELLSFCQILPGPNIINLSLILGWRFYGVRGAAAALLGMLLVPTILVLSLTVLYREYAHFPMVAGALQGMGAVAAGLMLATALKLGAALQHNALRQLFVGLPYGLVMLSFVMIAWLRWPLVWVVLGLGGLAVLLAWWMLHRQMRED